MANTEGESEEIPDLFLIPEVSLYHSAGIGNPNFRTDPPYQINKQGKEMYSYSFEEEEENETPFHELERMEMGTEREPIF